MSGHEDVMPYAVPLVLVVSVLGYACAARLLERVWVTAPMVFVAVGVLTGGTGLGLVSVEPDASWLLIVAELTLALLLFADASSLRLRDVTNDSAPVRRLLLIGFPLTLVAGTLLTMAVFPDRGWAAAALVAALVAPTDAALGAAVVNDERVPVRVRRMLNIESGLNDGLATPVVTVMIAVVASQAGQLGDESWEASAAWAPASGAAVAVVVGGVGGVALRRLRAGGWTSTLSEQVAILALALLSYLGAISIEGNGFVAAFLGGLVFAATWGRRSGLELTEESGLVASYVVWIVFGAAMVGPALERTSVRTVVVAIGMLTAARAVPVALTMARRGWGLPTVGFVSWFGPRGLATVIFALVSLESLGGTAVADHVLDVATLTVLLSILAHGLSAPPAATAYGRWVTRLPPSAPEHGEGESTARRRLDLHSKRGE